MAPALTFERAARTLRAELRDNPHLVPLQDDARRCLMYGTPSDGAKLLVPFLIPRAVEDLWLHLQPCHAEYSRSQAARVMMVIAATRS